MIARAELLLLHLESRLHEERAASERAARTTAEVEERLRIGVRMLQALDVQVERGEQATSQARELVDQADARLRAAASDAETTIQSIAERAVREKIAEIERELAWRFDRVKEVEERIEQAANGKLAWLDVELGARLARVNDACGKAEMAAERADAVLCRLAAATETIDRGEAVARALDAANTESLHRLESLAARTQDAAAMREALGVITQDVAASREVVQGELRRMRDDLFWLTERGERISSELVERADSACTSAQAMRSQLDALTPTLRELSAWAPLLSGENRERIRPVADAIAGRVRDELAIDMRGFSIALRQFADRADQAFAQVRLDPALVEVDAKSAARVFATELSRLGALPRATDPLPRGPIEDSVRRSDAPAVVAANSPIELSV
jgi:chromosome segregation ATPase